MNRCLRKHSSYRWHRLLGAFVCSLMIAGTGIAPASANEPGPVISVVVDGTGVMSDVSPVHQNGRMLVPIRVVAEATGSKVSYEATSQKVTLEKKGKHVTLDVGSKIAYVDGKPFTMDVSPVIMKKRTIVPIRFISEALGFRVQWDEKSAVAYIQSKPVDDEATGVKSSSNEQKDEKSGDASLLGSQYRFPFQENSTYDPYGNSFGFNREWSDSNSGDVRSHEGIDIMAPTGTPIYSVSDGTINRVGWNTYGGWRVNITDKSGKYRMYYAHMQAYAPGLDVGDTIKAGQLIGFVGDTGYGEVGTTGMFEPHLHFGLYLNSTGQAIDPFNYLRTWEQNKVESPFS